MSETKPQSKAEQCKEIQLQQIAKDRDEMDEYRRFGFFSIPYPATVGDLAYTKKKKKKIMKLFLLIHLNIL